MLTNIEGVAFRRATVDDTAFIMDSWLNSWRKSPWAGVILNNDYYKTTRSVIEHLVLRGANFEVACHDKDPERILGWICTESTNEQEPLCIVHCVYAKDAYLKLKVGAALLARAPGRHPGIYTFRTRQVEAVCRPAGFRHAPEAARRK